MGVGLKRIVLRDLFSLQFLQCESTIFAMYFSCGLCYTLDVGKSLQKGETYETLR